MEQANPHKTIRFLFNIDDHRDLILFIHFISFQPQNTLKITVSHHKTAATFTATDALKRKSPNDDHHRGFTFLFSFRFLMIFKCYIFWNCSYASGSLYLSTILYNHHFPHKQLVNTKPLNWQWMLEWVWKYFSSFGGLFINDVQV